MTHDELLARIKNELDGAEFDAMCNSGGQVEAVKALRAVVELHKDYTTAEGIKFCVICTRTEDKWEYPCATIQAIEKELS